jgi:hypothetical protein
MFITPRRRFSGSPRLHSTRSLPLLLSTIVSLLSVMPGAGDDSPGLGILWFLVFVAEASLLIPLSLGIAAEVIDRRAQLRRFQWPRVFLRFLLPPQSSRAFERRSAASFGAHPWADFQNLAVHIDIDALTCKWSSIVSGPLFRNENDIRSFAVYRVEVLD